MSQPAVDRSPGLRAAACLLLAPLLSTVVLAQPQAGYYDGVDTGDSAALRSTLHDVIDDHVRFPYTDNSTDTWDILNQADEDPNEPANIIDVYRNASYEKISGGIGAYNREHVWPNSYGFPDNNSDNYPFTDCHQLFLSDAGYNTSRSNKPYRYCSGSCDEKETLFNDGRGGGSGVYPGNSNWTDGSFTQGTWETWGGRKGDVARAIFYADIRYEGDFHGGTGASEPDLIVTDNESLIDQSNTGENEDVAYMGMLTDLVAWHEADPPDSRELSRNNVVESYQGNRNPFIDHPEWVDCLFNDRCFPIWFTEVGDCPGDIDIEASQLTPNGQVALIWSDSEGTSVVTGQTCTNTQLDLDNPAVLALFNADANGVLAFTQNVPSTACGLFLQVVDATSCETSNVVELQ